METLANLPTASDSKEFTIDLSTGDLRPVLLTIHLYQDLTKTVRWMSVTGDDTFKIPITEAFNKACGQLCEFFFEGWTDPKDVVSLQAVRSNVFCARAIIGRALLRATKDNLRVTFLNKDEGLLFKLKFGGAQ